ncbi:MAG: hypothetical protein EKK29_13790 [Hyphomicrobiales bacterium]|nr:MAG: hypothetical protein EKK29_13790 [Hyphomicrobiales bacterium]
MMAITVFSLVVSLPPDGIERLHRVLLTHGRIRDVLSEIAYHYLVKCTPDTTAGMLADIVNASLPGNLFFVVQCHHERLAGFVSDDAVAWLKADPPPPRGPDHEPDIDAIMRLPLLAGLEYAARMRRRSQRIAELQPVGNA